VNHPATPPDPATREATREAIAAAIERLLAARAAGSSICPSEVARALAPAPAWRALMPAVRDVARALARVGRLRVTQGEDTLHPDEPWRGAIRLRRPEGRP
jgi:hypothetical protein